MAREQQRVFEIDLIRGFVLVLVILFHLAYDFYIFLGLGAFSFINHPLFEALLRKPFIGVLILLSGISCSFSRNNLKRGTRMLFFSAVLTLITYVIDSYIRSGSGMIWFNILHVISISTLFYALLDLLTSRRRERTGEKAEEGFTVLLLLLGVYIALMSQILFTYPFATRPASWLLLPLGFPPTNIAMMDYLPLLPWLGIFFIGAAIGRVAYKEKKSRFTKVSPKINTVFKPLVWIGEHSLAVYVLHQPVLLLLILGLRALVFP